MENKNNVIQFNTVQYKSYILICDEKNAFMSNMKHVILLIPGEDESRLFSRNTLVPPASVGPSSPLAKRKKKRDLMEIMEEEAQELLSYFNHLNVDALLRLTRNTLEMLRKRIQGSSLMHFLGGSMLLLCSSVLFLKESY